MENVKAISDGKRINNILKSVFAPFYPKVVDVTDQISLISRKRESFKNKFMKKNTK